METIEGMDELSLPRLMQWCTEDGAAALGTSCIYFGVDCTDLEKTVKDREKSRGG
jgi:hypothetical protein